MDVRIRVLGSFEVEGLAPHKSTVIRARTLLEVLPTNMSKP